MGCAAFCRRSPTIIPFALLRRVHAIPSPVADDDDAQLTYTRDVACCCYWSYRREREREPFTGMKMQRCTLDFPRALVHIYNLVTSPFFFFFSFRSGWKCWWLWIFFLFLEMFLEHWCSLFFVFAVKYLLFESYKIVWPSDGRWLLHRVYIVILTLLKRVSCKKMRNCLIKKKKKRISSRACDHKCNIRHLRVLYL